MPRVSSDITGDNQHVNVTRIIAGDGNVIAGDGNVIGDNRVISVTGDKQQGTEPNTGEPSAISSQVGDQDKSQDALALKKAEKILNDKIEELSDKLKNTPPSESRGIADLHKDLFNMNTYYKLQLEAAQRDQAKLKDPNTDSKDKLELCKKVSDQAKDEQLSKALYKQAGDWIEKNGVLGKLVGAIAAPVAAALEFTGVGATGALKGLGFGDWVKSLGDNSSSNPSSRIDDPENQQRGPRL